MKKTTLMAFLLALLAPMMSAWALDTHSTHYGKIAVEVATGEGTVYVAEANNATTGQTSGTWNCKGSSSGDSKTWYIYAKANSEDWEFKGWSKSKTGTPEGDTTSPKQVSASTGTATNSSNPNTTTFYAHFASTLRDPFNITFVPGNYTVDGVAASSINVDNYKNLRKVKTVALEATDGKFLNWLINNQVVNGATYSLPCESDTTVEAVFLRDDQVTTVTTYDELTAALANAQYVKITIPSGKKITVAKGATLTIPAGKQLVVDGTLYVDGSLSIAGIVSGAGKLSKCFRHYVQTDENGASGSTANPFAPYPKDGSYNIKYWVTKGSTPSSSISVSGSGNNVMTVLNHVTFINGRGDEIRNTPVSSTASLTILTYNVDSSVAMNHVTSFRSSYDTPANAYTAGASAFKVLTADATYVGEASSKYSHSWGTTDCAGYGLTLSSELGGGSAFKFINGSITISGKVQATDCWVIKCSKFKATSYHSDHTKNQAFRFFDTESSGINIAASMATGGDGAVFYSGTYDFSFEDKSNWKVYGGLYKEDPTDFLAQGLNLVATRSPEHNNYYLVYTYIPQKVVQVGNDKENQFEKLQDAINAAADGQTIKLITNFTLREAVTIAAGKSVTIDLNGYGITNSTGSIVVENKGTLRIGNFAGDGGVCAATIINNGSVDVTYGTYSGAITLNAGMFTVHNGNFTGALATGSGVSDPTSVVALNGGRFKNSVEAFLGDGYDEVLRNGMYQVEKFPYAIKSTGSLSGAEKSWSLTSMKPEDRSIWLTQDKARSAFSSNADWDRYAELDSSLSPYIDFTIDCVLTFDRAVGNGSVKAFANAKVNINEALDRNLAANEEYRVLTTKIATLGSGWYQINFNRYLKGDDCPTTVHAGVADVNAANVGTVATLELQLCHSNRTTHVFNKDYVVATCRYMLDGKKAAVDRDDVRTAYDSLADAVSAGNLQNGDWILVGADFTEKITIAKAGTFTIDPYGFNYDTANVSVDTAYFTKSTAEVDSRAVAQNIESAKAKTYVVARKVAGVGGQFYDNLTEAVAAANGAVVTLYAATEETITLTAEGQSLKLAVADGVSFNDEQIATTADGCVVSKTVADGVATYTVVQNVVEDADGKTYASIAEALNTITEDEVAVTVTAAVEQNVELSEGKTLVVTVPNNVEASVNVTPADGSFLVTTPDANDATKTTYESKKITEEVDTTAAAVANVTVEKIDGTEKTEVTDTSMIGEAVATLTGNKALERADNTEILDVIDTVTVRPSSIVQVVEGAKTVIRSATFDVTPSKGGTTVTKPAKPVKFRLPVDSAVGQKCAMVYHDGAFFGTKPILSETLGSVVYKFLEIESDSFSPYGYEILDGETDSPVAIIGTTGYASLAAAVAAANAGDTVELIADDRVSLTSGGEIEINKPLTITGPVDANGDPLYTVYGTPSNTGYNDVFVASSSGTVTISNLAFAEFGNEAANSVNGRAPIFVSANNNNVVLENLAISNFNRTAIKINGGEFLVKDCYIDCDTDVTNYRVGGIDIANAATGSIDGTTIVNVDTSNPTDWVAAALELIGSGDILVQDCSITSSMYGIFVSTADGTSPGSSAVTVVNTTVDADMYALINDSDSDDAEIAVESGSYTGMLYAETETGLAISGGMFDDEIPEEYCADGYIPTDADPNTGLYTVKQGAYIAQIGETKYETLDDAISEAQDGDTVTLLDDVTLTEPLNVTLGDKAVTLDLGGKTLAGRTNLKSGSLTIKNGTVAGGSAQALNVYGSADPAAENYSVLTIASDVNVTADVYGVCMFGAAAGSNGYGAVVNIAGTVATTGDGRNGAVFVSGNLGKNVSGDMHNIVNVTGSVTSATDAAIAMNGSATVNVSGGATVTGNTAIAVKRGVLNVIGGTIRATGAKNYDAAAYANGTEMTGAAISVSDTYSQYGAMEVNVSGGTVKSDNADALFKKDGDYKADATIAVSAGSFSSAVADEYCATGYIPAERDPVTGLYTVREGTYVAQIVRGGSVVAKYEAFDTALTDALSGDTVQLLADVTGVTTTYNIDKALTIDGQGKYKIVAGANTLPRGIFESWGGGRAMFALTSSTANVTFKNLTIDNGEGHYYTYFVHVKSGSTATFSDVELLRGAEADASGEAGVGYGAAILADGGNVLVSGSFYADTHGEALDAGDTGDRTAGIFPFTAILYQGGGIHFDDGTTADIGQDLLLVGMQRSIDLSDETAKAEVQAMLDEMNVPAGYVPYTLKVADSEQFTFTGASPLGWNSIIDYGKDIMDVSSSLGFEMDKTTTPVEVGLVADTVLPDAFTYEDSNFTINGNGNALSGTIVYTDGAGTMENVAMGTEQAPLVLDMTGLGEGKSINLGTGIAADNVTIKITEEQAATQGQTIVTWNTEGETAEESAAMENGIKVEIVDEAGETIVDEETGKPQEASLVWDAEVGRAYIGPCEARLTTVDANNETTYIYTSLARAIELARNSGDTVTLMMDIDNFTGTQEIYKNLVLDGAGHKIAAKPVTTHRNVVSAFIGGTAMLKIEGHVTVKNITIDGDASHAYTYLISADNSNAALTTENVVLLHGGELCGDENGNVLEAGAGYGAAIHLNNGASIIVKDGFYADTHGAPAEPGQTIEKSDGVFPFTGILPEGDSSVEFRLTADTDATPTVAIGEDLLLVGMVGAIDSETAQGILDYMKVPSRFRPYTLTLGDGSAYAFTGASLRTWNDIIDYGKKIMDASTAIGYEGLDKTATPVEVGLLADTELPDTFTYQDANFSVNGNGNALSGTIKYTDDAGIIKNIVLGTEEKPLILDLRKVTEPVEIGNLIGVANVTVLMTAEQATLGQPVFTWNVETAGEPDNAESVKITVLESAEVPYDPEEEAVEKGLVWDDELGIAYIGPCEARLTGPEREPGYMDLVNAFGNAQDGDTVTVFWTDVSLGERVNLPAGELLFTKGRYDGITLGANAAFAFTNATTVFRSDMDLADAIVLAGDVADGYLLRTASDNTTYIYTVVQRGQYTVTGKTEDGSTGTATIKVSDDWIVANMSKASIAEVKTINEVENYLDSRDSTTGMRKWENYVLKQTENPFRVSGIAANGALSTTLSDTPEETATTGFTVKYALNEVGANGEVKTPGAKSDGHNFSVAVDSVASSALYKVRAYLTSGESTLVVDSANTIGALKVDSTKAETIVAVPWQGFGAADGAICVADFVRTATLSEGDEIYVYDGAARCYRAWSLTAQKTWEPMQSVTKEGVTAGVDAAAAKIARGAAAWLKRAAPSAPLYLVGEAPMQAVSTPLEPAQTAGVDGSQKWNLVAPVSAAPFNLNSIEPVGEFDRIVVPTAGAPLNYTYKDGAWGYDGVKQVQRGGRTVAVPCRITDAATLPAGTGFWYLNSSSSEDAAIAW